MAFSAIGATELGPPTDPSESERIEWVPVSRLRDEMAAGRVQDGVSLTALSLALLHGVV